MSPIRVPAAMLWLPICAFMASCSHTKFDLDSGGGGVASGNSIEARSRDIVWDAQVFDKKVDIGPERILVSFEQRPIEDGAIELLDARVAGASCLEYRVTVSVSRQDTHWAVYRYVETLPTGARVEGFVTDPPGRPFPGAVASGPSPKSELNPAYRAAYAKVSSTSLLLADRPVRCEWEVVAGHGSGWIDPATGGERVILKPTPDTAVELPKGEKDGLVPPVILNRGLSGVVSLELCHERLSLLRDSGESLFTALLRIRPDGWGDSAEPGRPDPVQGIVVFGRTPITIKRINQALNAANQAPAP